MSPIIKITFKEDNNLSMDVIKATLEMQLSNVVESVEVVDPAKLTTSHSLSDRLTRIEARLGLEPVPEGWLTREKYATLRTLGFSTAEARQILINGYGKIPEKYDYFLNIDDGEGAEHF